MSSVVSRLHTFRSREELTHRALASFNAERLAPALPSHDEDRPAAFALKQLELDLIEHERTRIADAIAEVPQRARAFIEWFECLRMFGPGQFDPLFDWLAEEASLDDMRWFLHQQIAGELRFDDIVAMTQVKMPPGVKLVLARNYWDQMGRGEEDATRSAKLDVLTRELDIDTVGGEVVWEALAVSNLMVAFATRKRYAFEAVGALAVIELTAPDRAERVDAGLARLGVSERARRYFTENVAAARAHAPAWAEGVLRPLIDEEPRRAKAIAEGALLRLGAGARKFVRCRRVLGV